MTCNPNWKGKHNCKGKILNKLSQINSGIINQSDENKKIVALSEINS